MYKDRQTLGENTTDDRIEYRKYSFESSESSFSGGKGKQGQDTESQKSSTPKKGSFGPVFKDREHFDSMHFF